MKDVTPITTAHSDAPHPTSLTALPLSPARLTVFPPRTPILTIEDNDKDFHRLDQAFKLSGLAVRLHRVLDLSSARSYLLNTDSFKDRAVFTRPCFVITNCRVETLSTREFITWIRHQPNLETLPIIVQSAGLTAEQRGELYQQGANFCLPKTGDVGQLARYLLDIHKVWAQLGLVPNPA